MEYVLIFFQIALAISFALLWLWIKQLPNAIHKRQEQLFQKKLAEELELLKIAQSQIQLRKIERFMDFAKIQTEIMTNVDFLTKIQNNDKDTMAKLRETIFELGIGLFFFASDSTVREYGKWKTETAKNDEGPYTVLSDLGKLMVALRRDVGYSNTQLNGADYLKMFITDWDETKSKITT